MEKTKRRLALRLMRAALPAWAVLAATPGQAQEQMLVHRADGVTLALRTARTDSIGLSKDGQTALFYMDDAENPLAVSEIDSITFGTASPYVEVRYDETGLPRVTNPYAFQGLEITVDGGQVTATYAGLEEVTYRLTGSGKGAFKLYSGHKQRLLLDGLVLTADDGPAINIQSKKKTTVELPEGTTSTLLDAATRTPCGDEDMKAALFSEGQLVFEGEGTLQATGRYKHAICSDDYVEIRAGHVRVDGAVGDGIHAKDYFSMSGGRLTVEGTTGDCVDADAGYVEIGGGELSLTVSTADTKALKCDSVMHIAGGKFDIRLNADQAKGLKSGQALTIDGGEMEFTCSGGVVVTDGDPSYCTAVKCGADLTVNGGTLTIRHTGTAGKGLSTDGKLTVTGGTLDISVSGAGGTYTNASNTSDTYSGTCLKADGDLFIQDGTLTLNASGTGGKCISADGNSVYGDDDHAPAITATTTGSKISSSGGNSGGGPGGWGGWGGGPGGGWDQSGTGGNPKAIRGEGNVTIENGSFSISTAQDGGEGIESKQTLTINGGTIEAVTYDDALNAGSAIVINGGRIYAYASNNDGIDSNGTLTVTGGIVIASGTTQPEEGFDCDQNTFKITGGVLVGTGGATSTPTSSVCTQCSAVYSARSAQQGTVYTVCRTSDGAQVLSFALPRSYSQMTMLFSSPELAASTGFTIYTGGTVTGGDAFRGLTTGAGFSGGTQAATFTTSSKVTTIR